MPRSDPLRTDLFTLQASVALGAGFGFFAAVPGVGFIIGGVFDVHRSQLAGAVVSVMAGVGLCVLAAVHWRRGIPDRLMEWAPGLVAVIVALQSAAQLVTTGDAQTSVLLLLGIVTTAATVPRWWLLAVAGAILAGAYVFALTVLERGPIEPAPVAALIISILMGTALYAYHSSGRRQLHALTERIGQLALRDPLTGVLNRRGLSENLPVTDAGASITAAICLDVNGFKAINDELGHATGDAILCTVAERLSCLVRREDIVARTGGDEFVIIAGLPDERALISLRERITGQLTGYAGPLELPWSVSVGTAWRSRSPGDDVKVETLMHEADIAMYDDKRRHHRDRRRLASARREI